MRYYTKYFFAVACCLILLLSTLHSCSPKVYQSAWYLPNEKNEMPWKQNKICFNSENYNGSTKYVSHTPIKYIKLSFHFFRDSNQQNFSPYEASKYANDLVAYSNDKLANNQPMNLPLGNNTPVLPIRYRYIIDTDSAAGKEAIHYHTDNEVAYMNKKNNSRNIFWNAPYEKYGIKTDNAIDVFMLEHPKDSIDSPTYKASMDGIGAGDWMKIVGAYQHSLDSFVDEQGIKKRKWAEQYVGLFNHEAGHIVGLPHTWKYNDGCDDTPHHANCWNYSEIEPCNREVSNNMMDYNAYQNSLTPCQIGKVNFNLLDKHNSIRKYLQNNWCAPQKMNDITIPKNTVIEWQCNKEVEGNIILKENSVLKIYCALSMPQNSTIKVLPGAKLILDGCKIYNECGFAWEGIEILSAENKSGIVEILNGAIIGNISSEKVKDNIKK